MRETLRVLDAVARGEMSEGMACEQLSTTPAQLRERMAFIALVREAAARETEQTLRADRKRQMKILGGAVFLSLSASVALAANGNCPNGLPFCFAADTPAVASQINHNFAQLKEWLEAKTGPVSNPALVVPAGSLVTNTVTGTSSVTSSGPITGSRLAVSDQVSVSPDSVSVPGMWVPVKRSVVSSAAEINFTGIPAGYRFLKLVIRASTTRNEDRWLMLQFNGDTSASYNREYRDLAGTYTAGSNGQPSAIVALLCRAPPSGTPTGFMLGELLINNFGERHDIIGLGSCHAPNVAATTGVSYSQWVSTAEINRIRLYSDPLNGASAALAAGSEVTLLGLR